MGSEPAGKIAEELEQLRREIIAALNAQEVDRRLKANPRSPLAQIPRAFFIEGEVPRLPEIFALYRRLKETGLPWRAGGLSDQLEHFAQVLDACALADEYYHSVTVPYYDSLEKPHDGGSASWQVARPGHGP